MQCILQCKSTYIYIHREEHTVAYSINRLSEPYSLSTYVQSGNDIVLISLNTFRFISYVHRYVFAETEKLHLISIVLHT